MIFFSNFKACLEEKRGVAVFRRFFFRIFLGGIFGWDDFQMSHMKINKNMKMHALLDEEKELLQCGIEAMMWQQNGNLYDLNHLPKSKPVAFALQLRETEPTCDPSDQTDHQTPQDKLRLRHWSFLRMWDLLISCASLFHFKRCPERNSLGSIQKIEGKMWLDSIEVLVIQQQLVPDTN